MDWTAILIAAIGGGAIKALIDAFTGSRKRTVDAALVIQDATSKLIANYDRRLEDFELEVSALKDALSAEVSKRQQLESLIDEMKARQAAHLQRVANERDEWKAKYEKSEQRLQEVVNSCQAKLVELDLYKQKHGVLK